MATLKTNKIFGVIKVKKLILKNGEVFLIVESKISDVDDKKVVYNIFKHTVTRTAKSYISYHASEELKLSNDIRDHFLQLFKQYQYNEFEVTIEKKEITEISLQI